MENESMMFVKKKYFWHM